MVIHLVLKLFLGSYRENEVSSSHPLINMLDAIKAQGASIVTIKVGEYSMRLLTYHLYKVVALHSQNYFNMSSIFFV